jgi:hypothetical protein
MPSTTTDLSVNLKSFSRSLSLADELFVAASAGFDPLASSYDWDNASKFLPSDLPCLEYYRIARRTMRPALQRLRDAPSAYGLLRQSLSLQSATLLYSSPDWPFDRISHRLRMEPVLGADFGEGHRPRSIGKLIDSATKRDFYNLQPQHIPLPTRNTADKVNLSSGSLSPLGRTSSKRRAHSISQDTSPTGTRRSSLPSPRLVLFPYINCFIKYLVSAVAL